MFVQYVKFKGDFLLGSVWAVRTNKDGFLPTFVPQVTLEAVEAFVNFGALGAAVLGAWKPHTESLSFYSTVLLLEILLCICMLKKNKIFEQTVLDDIYVPRLKPYLE